MKLLVSLLATNLIIFLSISYFEFQKIVEIGAERETFRSLSENTRSQLEGFSRTTGRGIDTAFRCVRK